MKFFTAFFLLMLLIPSVSIAQVNYMALTHPKYQITGVKVIEHGHVLQNPWVGGFNNPVISPIDLNQDGLMDLFVYDKSAWKALSFINTGSNGHPSFTYDPHYDLMYPTDLRDWALIRDYNHDGISDIIALTINSDMEVYKGYRSGDTLTWLMTYTKLIYPLGIYPDHIWTFSDNIPVLMDIDGDGAMDVLASTIGGGFTLNYYRNQAVDSGWSADSLNFVLENPCWGRFIEDGGDCNVALGACILDTPADGHDRDLRHQGGAGTGMHYYTSPDSAPDVILADIYCNTTKFLKTSVIDSNYTVISADTLFPSYDVPVNLPLFPAGFLADVDNDGREDLLFAPFASNANVLSQSEDINVIKYYHNIANDTVNKFHYEGDTLLNNGVVDVGTESHPVFFDFNGDSLMDIVIGNYGRFDSQNVVNGYNGYATSFLTLYKNTGTDTMPIFELFDTDWNQLSAYKLNGIYPAFGDLDGDGLPDMVVGEIGGNIEFFKNRGIASNASYPSMTSQNWFGINVGQNSAPFIYDVNGDGLNDLVIGSSGRDQGGGLAGHIFYYWNFGTRDTPMFSPDSVNDFFGNMEVWDYHLGAVPAYATPFIMRDTGGLALYAGCERGWTLKYAINPDSLRSGTFALLDSAVLGINPGQRSTVCIADINRDGRNDYLTGNMRGGLMLFSDTMWGPPLDLTPSAVHAVAGNELQIFPNPARDKVICRMSPGASQIASARLYDILGEQVSVPMSGPDENSITLSVANLSNGLYVIEARDYQNKVYQGKVAVYK